MDQFLGDELYADVDVHVGVAGPLVVHDHVGPATHARDDVCGGAVAHLCLVARTRLSRKGNIKFWRVLLSNNTPSQQFNYFETKL